MSGIAARETSHTNRVHSKCKGFVEVSPLTPSASVLPPLNAQSNALSNVLLLLLLFVSQHSRGTLDLSIDANVLHFSV